MATTSQDFNAPIEFSEASQQALNDFGVALDEIKAKNLDFAAQSELVEKIKSEFLIKICSLGEDPEKIAQLVDELDLGKVLNKFDDHDVSPLMAYINSSNHNIDIKKFIDELKEKGLQVGAKNKFGNSALHLIILQGKLDQERLKEFLAHAEVIKVINVKNNEGKTALDYAIEQGNQAFSKLLVDQGAKIGSSSTNQDPNADKDSGRHVGSWEEKARKFNEELEAKQREDAKEQQELLDELKAQKEADELNEKEMRRLEEMKIQIELHNELKKFVAEELARRKIETEYEEKQAIEAEESQSAQLDLEEIAVDIDSDNNEELDLDKNNANIIDIGGDKIDLTNQAAVDLLLHYYALKGNLGATKALLPYADITTFVAGRSVYEVALDSGNSELCSAIRSQYPQVTAIVRSEYQDRAFGELIKDNEIQLDCVTPANNESVTPETIKDNLNITDNFVDKVTSEKETNQTQDPSQEKTEISR